jgi:tyrosinase
VDYWNWGADAANLEKSQVFDGSDTSMSGNGAYTESTGDIQLSLGNYPVQRPSSSNCGYVRD